MFPLLWLAKLFAALELFSVWSATVVLVLRLAGLLGLVELLRFEAVRLEPQPARHTHSMAMTHILYDTTPSKK